MNKDLSVYSTPVETSSSHLQPDTDFSLQKTDIQQFHQQGFIIGRGLICSRLLEDMLEDLADLMSPDHAGREYWYEYNSNESTDPDTVLFHALGAWRLRRSFHDLLWEPAITVPAGQLLDTSVRFWHDQLFCKPALHGGVVAWHQDYSYWTRTTPMNHLTCWIALEDATVANGCIHYINGSHNWDLLPITGLAGGMASISKVLTPDQAKAFATPTPIELKAGQVVFHHPLTVHGSFENRTQQSRRAAVVNMIADGVQSCTNESLLSGVPVFPKGEPLNGRFFPLLRE